MPVKAIITDLDGTILPRGGEISSQTKERLEHLGEKGIVRIIATGRTLFAARQAIPDDFPIDYLVFSSGAGCVKWENRKIVAAHHISREESRKIAEYLWNYNINFTIQREIPDNHHFYFTQMYPLHEDYLRRVEKFREFGTPIDNSNEIDSDSTQFVMILDAQHLRLIEQIRQDLPDFSVVRSTSPFDYKAIWLEIYPKNVNKGYCCETLLHSIGIRGSECAGIGNDYNDLDFLDICGQAFLVRNAPEQLKKGPYKIVASDLLEGFSEFISKSFFNNS